MSDSEYKDVYRAKLELLIPQEIIDAGPEVAAEMIRYEMEQLAEDIVARIFNEEFDELKHTPITGDPDSN